MRGLERTDGTSADAPRVFCLGISVLSTPAALELVARRYAWGLGVLSSCQSRGTALQLIRARLEASLQGKKRVLGYSPHNNHLRDSRFGSDASDVLYCTGIRPAFALGQNPSRVWEEREQIGKLELELGTWPWRALSSRSGWRLRYHYSIIGKL